MEAIFYIIIFVIGAIVGRFYCDVIKSMSRGRKGIFIRKYCINCGERFNFFEKIPIISYILLRGKCRHCGRKIDIKYIILETVTGLIFLFAALGLKIVKEISLLKMISYIFTILYLSYIILVSGIDKETRNMPSALLAYGVIISLIYIAYLCIIEEVIYRYIIYLVILAMLLLINIINTKKRARSSYVLDLLTMLLIMIIFTEEAICISTIIATLIAISIYLLIKKIKNNTKKGKTTFNLNIKIVFIMGCLNILSFLLLINIA